MALNEFDIIRQYFTRPPKQPSVVQTVGDDCAIVTPSPNKQLVFSLDTLVESRHFPESAPAYDIATRALCTSISDLAAMGAKPLWFTLGLTLPEKLANRDWLSEFSRGMFSIAEQFEMDLIGGDTTKGPLTISVQVHGEVEPELLLKRDQAAVGDWVFVTGCLGDGAAGLAVVQDQLDLDSKACEYFYQRFYAPSPKIQAGQALGGIASAAIDISDGLLADAGHIAKASGVDIIFDIEALPISPYLHSLAPDQYRGWALTGGDDYQLLFTLSPEKLDTLESLVEKGLLQAHKAGQVVAGTGEVRCEYEAKPYSIEHLSRGYQHFAS